MASLPTCVEDSADAQSLDEPFDQNSLDSNDIFTFTEKVTVTKYVP